VLKEVVRWILPKGGCIICMKESDREETLPVTETSQVCSGCAGLIDKVGGERPCSQVVDCLRNNYQSLTDIWCKHGIV
jgi:hypothetical protein